MLNKEVCIKCYNKHAEFYAPFDGGVFIDISNRMPCPACFSPKSFTYIYKPPPEWCPYALEHALAGGQSC